MTDEKLDPYSPEGLREIARMGMAVSGPYLREIAERLEQQASKLDAEMKRTAEAMQLVHDRTARGDSWMEMCDELEAKLKAATSRLHNALKECERLDGVILAANKERANWTEPLDTTDDCPCSACKPSVVERGSTISFEGNVADVPRYPTGPKVTGPE